MKGIAILFVLIGHFAVFEPLHLQRLAFSFHMPLFFIISGVFYKPKKRAQSFLQDLKHLILPLLFTLFVYAFFSYGSGNNSSFTEALNGLFGCTATTKTYTLFLQNAGCIGILWFLPGLFWCKNLYNILYTYFDIDKFSPPMVSSYRWIIFCLGVILVSIFTTYISRYIITIPFGLSHGLSAMMFFCIGDMLKLRINDPFNFKLFLLSLLMWGLSFLFSPSSVGEFYYRILPLNVVGAIGACYCLLSFAKIIVGKSLMAKPMAWLGQNSLAIYCYHAICLSVLFFVSGKFGVWDPWDPHFVLAIHIIFCIVMTWISSRFTLLRNLYGIRSTQK